MAADLRTCLPDFIREQLAGALPVFDRKLHGFASREAILLAIESRTSSPIQLQRWHLREAPEAPSHGTGFVCR
ncbi:hypothetical protein GALL_539330 [mine drainage metagenome]|uniref:FAD-dependent protein C-terminal domain-containing protein n=1 Tax=mine drainage metagenome TaxID=410659 RepID=A0A1J5PGY0_9ZZZZ